MQATSSSQLVGVLAISLGVTLDEGHTPLLPEKSDCMREQRDLSEQVKERGSSEQGAARFVYLKQLLNVIQGMNNLCGKYQAKICASSKFVPEPVIQNHSPSTVLHSLPC